MDNRDEDELVKHERKEEKKRLKKEKRKRIGQWFAIVGMGILSSLGDILEIVGGALDNN